MKFDDIPVIYHFSADKNENKSTKLHVTVQEYRRAVDKQAKLYGLRAAFGHDQPFKDPYPYDHKVGLENMVKYNNK
ncbi:hypothetical protein [Candidatus Arsenophonus triatominarum]|uniref:hypothetical protein n=1 Tax=Candidatus Arsenophonus triatominarum TaxID=57911 RepID=UPI0016509A73|nr:hypothetical protein [Candidatus Arsenophonus triatominarum]